MGLSYIGFGLLELAQIRMSMASRRMQRGKIRIDREPGVRGAEPRRSRGVIDDAELPAIARDSCRARAERVLRCGDEVSWVSAS